MKVQETDRSVEQKHGRQYRQMINLTIFSSIVFDPFEFYSVVSRRFHLVSLALLIIFCAGNIVRGQDGSDEPPDPVAVFNQGQDAHEKGDLRTAIELYTKALKLTPDFPEAELQLGNALQAEGKIDEAETAFRKATELRPDWPLAITSLGSLLVAKGAFAEARPLLEKAINADDQNASALSAMTDLLLQTNAKAGELHDILTRVSLLTAKANPTAAIWAARGMLEAASGDVASAKRSIAQALTLDPRNKAALFQKASISLKENDAAGAEETALALEKLTGNSERAVVLHAEALFEGGKTAEAITMINSIPNPGKATIEVRSAMTASGSEDPAELEGRLASDPKSSPLLERLCGLYRVSDPNKALDYCRRAADADPKNIKPAIGFGAALVQAKRYDDAIVVFRKLVAIAPDNATIHGNLATALFQSKRYQEAEAEYQWLTAKQPDLAIAYFFLAICHDQLREYLDAMANYQQFLRLADPEKQKLEIDKVNLRVPSLQQQIKKGAK